MNESINGVSNRRFSLIVSTSEKQHYSSCLVQLRKLKRGAARKQGNFCCHIALISMAYENRVKPAVSGVEREARLEKRRIEAEKALAEHRKAEAAFRANYERLKAERLAREGKR